MRGKSARICPEHVQQAGGQKPRGTHVIASEHLAGALTR